ncbi:hypothetical protein Ga0123461_1087 [Mariprofundus aestuarium]|uniref:PilZ domain-containing protein n=1 Tax=Mariprofundus aestuarium TaxID=1921086 RepID=A0A2K8L5J9_MARES|nr:hypothetical protein [Mariprofundus aestuarium]ATX79506.1 hypothetical protein Ga0123461_1087 [Mariprofundus aestuarium]
MSSSKQERISLSLDTELRLHPQRLNLGQAELLTDAITLPFDDIEGRLNQYAIHSGSVAERKKLCSSMKGFLGRLNANPMIPLSFRLKVLSRFEKELELFDGEMTAAILNAHKIAVDLVQKEARTDSSYYAPLIEMITNAIELALKMLKLTVAQYQATMVITTRQFFALAKLGLDVATSIDAESSPEQKRLIITIGKHELLRAMDFYRSSPEQQRLILKELEHHVSMLDAHFCPQHEKIEGLIGATCLISNINRPNIPPKLINNFQGGLPYDALALKVDSLIQRVTTAVERTNSLQQDHERQRVELQTEEAMRTTLVGGQGILDALLSKYEKEPRGAIEGVHLNLEWDCAKAFSKSSSNMDGSDQVIQNWNVVNISQNGACIERLDGDDHATCTGSMIGLDWVPALDRPRLGFVRWMKRQRGGDIRLGIHFFQQPVKLLRASIDIGSKEMSTKRLWPLLILPGTGILTAYFPETHIHCNMIFIIRSGDEDIHFKVMEVDEVGPNYSKCKIVRARVKGEEN